MYKRKILNTCTLVGLLADFVLENNLLQLLLLLALGFTHIPRVDDQSTVTR